MTNNKKARQDVIVSIFIYVFIALAFLPTIKMKNGAQMMPWLILAIALLCNTINLIRTIAGAGKKTDSEGYLSFSDIKIPLLVFLGIVVYAIMIKYTNYFVATGIFLPVFMLLEKVKKYWMIALIDVIYLVFIYIMFIVVLKVPLLG